MLGPGHIDTIRTRHDLATIAALQGRYAQAETELPAVLAARQQILGAEHPATLRTRRNLAWLATRQGRHQHAEDEYLAILDIQRRTLGTDNPETQRRHERVHHVDSIDSTLHRQNTLAGIARSGRIGHEVIHVRTRLRRLRIDGRTFVWQASIRHVQGSGDCHRCIRVRVWGAGKTSQVLQADLLSVAWPAPMGACATDGAYPTPSDARAIISYALKHGWQPERRGGAFVLSEHDDAAGLTLPDFLLTDRLRTLESADPTVRVVRAHELRHSS